MENAPVRIAVLVSGGGTNLQALLDAEKAGRLRDGRIVLVLSSKAGAYALERAGNAGVKAVAIEKKNCASQEEFENRLLEQLKNEKIGLVVLAGFMTVLGPTFIQEYKNRIVNVHPSLIPSFCGKGFYGLKVHEAALAYGVKVTGATVHFVNEIPDGGAIIAQKAVDVREGDTPETLQRRVMEEAEWKLLPEAVEKICARMRKGEEA